MLKCMLIFTMAISTVYGDTWVRRANLKNYIPYWQTLMQETFNEVEKREWCNLKLTEITQNIDVNLYNLQVNGTVRYTNGFVISIQKIDVTNIRQSVTSTTVDDKMVIFGTVRGDVNLRDLKVGFDVTADLNSPKGIYKSTVTFLHASVTITLDMTQNLITKEYSSSPSIGSFGYSHMIFMPSSNITEAFRNRFALYEHSTQASAGIWATDIFIPIMKDIATNKLRFPDICFTDCT